MGFDLNMVNSPRFQVAQGEWRTSGEGISQLMELMAYVDVLDTENEPENGPEWPPEGMDEARAEALADWLRFDAALDAPATPEEEASARAWLGEDEAWRAAPSAIPGKVAAWKFASNENWHVTSAECELIASALEALLEDGLPDDLAEMVEREDDDEDELLEWVEDWKDYNRVAATHGGYRVT